MVSLVRRVLSNLSKQTDIVPLGGIGSLRKSEVMRNGPWFEYTVASPPRARAGMFEITTRRSLPVILSDGTIGRSKLSGGKKSVRFVAEHLPYSVGDKILVAIYRTPGGKMRFMEESTKADLRKWSGGYLSGEPVEHDIGIYDCELQEVVKRDRASRLNQ